MAKKLWVWVRRDKIPIVHKDCNILLWCSLSTLKTNTRRAHIRLSKSIRPWACNKVSNPIKLTLNSSNFSLKIQTAIWISLYVRGLGNYWPRSILWVCQIVTASFLHQRTQRTQIFTKTISRLVQRINPNNSSTNRTITGTVLPATCSKGIRQIKVGKPLQVN